MAETTQQQQQQQHQSILQPPPPSPLLLFPPDLPVTIITASSIRNSTAGRSSDSPSPRKPPTAGVLHTTSD